MSRALVLGGGGPVGIAWQSGLAVGLAAAGTRWADADLIVGTSAGSVVGAILALGDDVATALPLVARPLPLPDGVDPGMAALFAAMDQALSRGATATEVRTAVGRVALDSKAVDEETFVAFFATVEGRDWPAAYRATAVDTATGERRVWSADSGVGLGTAVASSCAVPGVFPPITIGGRRYMDGGIHTVLNADLAAGHEAVVAVSCLPLALPEGFSLPALDAINAQQAADLAQLVAGGARLGVIAPGEEFLELSGWGLSLMDPTLAPAAFEVGRRQAEIEAPSIGAVWSL